jgi:replicative DNA helicase
VKPPANSEAERALLSIVLQEAAFIPDIQAHLNPADFSDERHTAIFKAMVAVDDANVTLDPITLSAELQRQGALEGVGGIEYLKELKALEADTIGLAAYCEAVADCAVRRKLLSLGLTKIANSKGTPDELIQRAHTAIDKIEVKHAEGDPISLEQAATNFEQDVERMIAHPGETWGVPTKLIGLDRVFGGLVAGEVWIIAANPGMGKTQLLNKIIQNVVMQDVPTLYFTLEMSISKIMMRFTADMADVSSARIRQGKIGGNEQALIAEALKRFRTKPLFLYEKPLTSEDAIGIIKRMRVKPRVIGIDYSLRFTDKANENETLRVANVIRNAGTMAKMIGATVIMIHTLTGVDDWQVPSLSNLAWTNRAGYDPDVVITPWFDKRRKEGDFTAKIVPLKYRDGPCPSGKGISMFFSGIRWGDLQEEK